MSAAVWDPSFAPGHAPAPSTRPQLTLLPGGRDAVRVTAPRTRLRLTRWGRLAITLAVLVAAITLATSLVGNASTSAPAPTAQVTVEAGQTLSEIAARAMPDLPVRDAVAKIAIANDLPNHHVNAGQTLTVPSS